MFGKFKQMRWKISYAVYPSLDDIGDENNRNITKNNNTNSRHMLGTMLLRWQTKGEKEREKESAKQIKPYGRLEGEVGNQMKLYPNAFILYKHKHTGRTIVCLWECKRNREKVDKLFDACVYTFKHCAWRSRWKYCSYEIEEKWSVRVCACTESNLLTKISFMNFSTAQ